jgi:hypothetical protein
MATQTRQVVVQQTLAAAIADAGTLTLSYPSGTNQAYFTSGNAKASSVAIINDSDIWLQTASKIGVTFGASDITLTNSSGVTWAAGSKLVVGLAYADGTDKFEGQKSAAITSLTDNSAGTASDTLAAISGTYSQAEVRNSVASLAAKINRVIAALNKAGIIA